MSKRAKLTIEGHVQGVFFRQSTQDQARDLHLTGWVRNQPDGTVVAVAEGPKENLERLIDWCRQGPPAAEVKSVNVEWMAATGEFQRFKIR